MREERKKEGGREGGKERGASYVLSFIAVLLERVTKTHTTLSSMQTEQRRLKSKCVSVIVCCLSLSLPPSIPLSLHPSIPSFPQLVRNVLTVDFHVSKYKSIVKDLQKEVCVCVCAGVCVCVCAQVCVCVCVCAGVCVSKLTL